MEKTEKKKIIIEFFYFFIFFIIYFINPRVTLPCTKCYDEVGFNIKVS